MRSVRRLPSACPRPWSLAVPLVLSTLSTLLVAGCLGDGGDDVASPPPVAGPPAPVTPPPPAPPPVTPPPPPVAGTVSASGSLAVTGGNGMTFSPQDDGFEISVTERETTYRFLRDTPIAVGAGTSTLHARLEVVQPVTGPLRVVYTNPQSLSEVTQVYICPSNCTGVTISAATGATHPVTVQLANLQIGGLSLTGSLTGDASDALWSPPELPATTQGPLGINGVDNPVLHGQTTTLLNTDGSVFSRTVALTLLDGTLVSAVDGAGGVQVQLIKAGVNGSPTVYEACYAACNTTLTASGGGFAVAFNNAPLSGGITLSRSVTVGAPAGSLTSDTLGGFTPGHDDLEAVNDLRHYTFDVLGTPAQGGISLVTVTVRGSLGIEVGLSTGIGSAVYHCFETAAPSIGIPACSGVTLAADQRTLTFTDAVVAGGAVGQATQSVRLNGSLTAQGR